MLECASDAGISSKDRVVAVEMSRVPARRLSPHQSSSLLWLSGARVMWRRRSPVAEIEGGSWLRAEVDNTREWRRELCTKGISLV